MQDKLSSFLIKISANKKLIFSILIAFLYAIITLVAVLHHEIWADEAQVWMLCKNLSIPQLINHLHNEGHPALLYLLTMPFAKISSNIIFMQLICWAFMCLAVFILLYKSPFNIFIKMSIILSAGFLYFLPVMARGYSLIPFFTLMAAMLYSKRKEHPILYAIPLFFLANTHVIMFGFVGILFVYFLQEIIKEKSFSKQNIFASFVIFTGLLLVVLQLYDTTQSNVFIAYNSEYLILKIYKTLSFFFITFYNNIITINDSMIFPIIDIPCIVVLFLSFLLFIINLYINSKKLFLIAFTGIGFQFFIYFFVYNQLTYVTRIYCTLIILIFCFWILYEENIFDETKKISTKKFTTIILTLFFALSIYNGINYYNLELKYDYAGAKETANFIKKNLPQNAVYLIDNEPYMIALAYYLGDDYKLYSITRNKTLNYVVWDKISNLYFSNEASSMYCTTLYNYRKNIYVIKAIAQERINDDAALEDVEDSKFKLLYSSGYTIEPNESYKVYKFVP